MEPFWSSEKYFWSCAMCEPTATSMADGMCGFSQSRPGRRRAWRLSVLSGHLQSVSSFPCHCGYCSHCSHCSHCHEGHAWHDYRRDEDHTYHGCGCWALPTIKKTSDCNAQDTFGLLKSNGFPESGEVEGRRVPEAGSWALNMAAPRPRTVRVCVAGMYLITASPLIFPDVANFVLLG
jgi:hypothetical protein